MFILSSITMSDTTVSRILFDSQTTMPLFYPLRYSIDHLNNKSISTQDASLQAIKYFYDYWFLKYKVTFCYSFYKSNHNPSIAIDELDNFFNYLRNGNSYTPNIIKFAPNLNSNIYTHAERVRSVARFIKYLISKYTNAYYNNSEPKELLRYGDRLHRSLMIKTEEFNSLYKGRKDNQANRNNEFKSLTKEMVKAVYSIITPSNEKKPNGLNPFSTAHLQVRNAIIVNILLKYGLRVGELMLLEIESIGKNMKGDKYSLVVTSVSDDNFDPRYRLPSIKTSNAHRLIEIEKEDYEFLQMYIKRIRPKSKHRFIFTTLKKPFNPLSYDAIYLLFSKINDVLMKTYPEFRNPKYSDSIDKLTPHVARHTWAYLALERIYRDKHNELLKLSSLSDVNFINNNIMEDSKSELREIAGWSYNSNMPSHYAKRFISNRANKSNLDRIKMDIPKINIYPEDF